MIAASACVDNDEQEEDCDDVFLPNIENIERKTRQSSLHHSDSRSSGIFSQVVREKESIDRTRTKLVTTVRQFLMMKIANSWKIFIRKLKIR